MRGCGHGCREADTAGIGAINDDLPRRRIGQDPFADSAGQEHRHHVTANEKQQEGEPAIDEPDGPRDQERDVPDRDMGVDSIDDRHPGERRHGRRRKQARDNPEIEIAKDDLIDAQAIESRQSDRD